MVTGSSSHSVFRQKITNDVCNVIICLVTHFEKEVTVVWDTQQRGIHSANFQRMEVKDLTHYESVLLH